MIKKKGRKPKSYYENLKNDLSLNNQEQTIEEVKPVKEHKKKRSQTKRRNSSRTNKNYQYNHTNTKYYFTFKL